MTRRWKALSLTQQFSLLSVLVIGAGMLAIGVWVKSQISALVIQNAAASTALYVDSFIEPVCQDLTTDGTKLPPQSVEKLQQLFSGTSLGRRIPSMKLWSTRGEILYSTLGEAVGQKFPITASLKGALEGRVVSEFDDLGDEENKGERALKVSLLEIYTPIHAAGTADVIAVAEIYEVADSLKSDLDAVSYKTWGVVGLVCLGMIAALFGIVRRGNVTIVAQRQQLVGQIGELQTLLEENQQLRRTVDDTHRRAAQSTERFMRRIGHELHDGPGQSIGLVMLHIEDLFSEDSKRSGPDSLAFVSGLLGQAMQDLRGLAQGLAPPELEGLTVQQAILLAVNNHEYRTRTKVYCEVDTSKVKLPPLVTTCIYRVAQEALNNSYKHAGGKGQAIRASIEASQVRISLSDAGPGISGDDRSDNRIRLGLSIMRDRVESLGGQFSLKSKPGAGTVIDVALPIGSPVAASARN